jgi:hypothetical protein
VTSLKVFLQLFKLDHWRHLHEAKILAVRHDDDCSQILDGMYYAPLIDSLLDEIQDVKKLTIASPFSNKVGVKSYSKALSFNSSFAREIIVNRLRRLMGLESRVPEIKTWRIILRKVKPSYVIGIQPNSALCRACHEQGIYIFDVQHGVIGLNHPWYSEKRLTHSDKLELVDCILCWDEESAGILRNWNSLMGIDIRVIGNPWINKFLINRSGDKQIKNFKNIKSGEQFTDNRPRILVSLQWGLDNPVITPNQSLFDNEFMPTELKKAIKNTQGKYDWIMRPHPVQLMSPDGFDKLRLFVKSNFSSNVLLSENDPLPHALANIDLHITYNSSVVIEAGYFGIPSAILDPQISSGLWTGYYSSQIIKGIAKLIPCEAFAIEEWIQSCCFNDSQRKNIPDIPESYAEFIKEIQRSKP